MAKKTSIKESHESRKDGREKKGIRERKESKDKKENGFIRFLRILIWPFKILFILISWIVKIIVLGIEKLIDMARKKKQQKVENDPDKIDQYVPFSVVKSVSGSFSKFESMLSKKDSTIGIILGARGSGKSAFGLKLLENLHATGKRKIFAMGFKAGELPLWIHAIADMDQIENNAFVLIDEGGILFNARQGFSDANQLLSKLLLIARHKDLSIMFISQNSSNLEINAIRQADYLILKPSSLLQLDFERKKIKEIYLEAKDDFDRYKNTKGITYIYSDAFRGFVANPLPTFWTQNISKSFSGKKE